jgi:WhiB family redox-sensing transcriptional regulator
MSSRGLEEIEMTASLASRSSVAAAAASRADLEWRGEALCAQTDPELFFPEKGGSPVPAKRVCRVCPVRLPCLAFALAGDERHGVWGGLSERERRRVRRRGVVRAASTTPAAPAAPAAGGASRAVAS